MVISRIIVLITPSEREQGLPDPPEERTLVFERSTKTWTVQERNGLQPFEVKLAAALDEVRGKMVLS